MTAVKGQLTTRERPCDSMERQLTGGNRPQQGRHGLATKSPMKKILPEPARAGAEDGSSADNPVMNTGMEQITRLMISIPEAPTVTAGHNLQNCICGWTKVTSTQGLKIHQGKKGCLKKGQQGSRIDSYFLRSRPSQSTEVQQQDTHHSLQDINTPALDEEQHGTRGQPESNPSRPTAEKKIQGRKPLVKWPKACNKTMWKETNTNLCNMLEGIRGTALEKLDRMGDLIYAYGVERFGVVESKRSTPSIATKSRRQTEIDRLVKETVEEAMEEGHRGGEGGYKPVAERDPGQACDTEES